MPGDVLAGKYEIVSLLGEGGMGTVWRARSLVLDIDVAIKVLHVDHADAHSAHRLLREARATASVGHPSIVRAFDFGKTEAGEPYLVMELLEGTSLADWLDRNGRMSAAEAVQLLLPVASGLAAAHARGIVHRDIKPENILLVTDGAAYVPKIVDFGIAKLAQRDGHVITQAGMVLGSLEYMSPEQAEGKQEVSEQTDVWALCVVLYELITGRRPFEGQSITAIIYALYTLDPVPTTQFAAGDDELWDIIARGLQKSVADRWPTMLELGRALASWAVQHGITADATGTALTRHWLASTTPSDAPVESPISSARAGVAPYWPRVSLVSIDTRANTESQPAVAAFPAVIALPAMPRAGTIQLAFAAPGHRVVTPATRRPRPALFGALLALVVAPLVVGVTMFASSGDSATRNVQTVVSAATPGSPVDTRAEWTTPTPAPAAADPLPSPSVVVPAKAESLAPTASNLRAQTPAPSALPNRIVKAMPLPAAPNF